MAYESSKDSDFSGEDDASPKRWTKAIDDDLTISPPLVHLTNPLPTDLEEVWIPEVKEGHGIKTSLIVAAASLLITAVGILVFQANNTGEGAPVNPLPRPNLPPPSFMERATTAEIHAEIEQTLRGFLDASNFADRCHHVVGGSEVEDRMREFYQRPSSPIPKDFGTIVSSQQTAFAGIPMVAVTVAESNGRTGWLLNLFPTRDRMLLDWESSVAYGEKSWTAFLKDRSPEPVAMRVYLKRSYRFEAPYDDEQEFQVFEVTTRGSGERLYGYLPRDSALSLQLLQLVPLGASHPVNLRLHWPSTDPENKSILIHSLLHNFWVDTDRLLRTVNDATSPAQREESSRDD